MSQTPERVCEMYVIQSGIVGKGLLSKSAARHPLPNRNIAKPLRPLGEFRRGRRPLATFKSKHFVNYI